VATDAQLTKAQANKLASMAHDGLSRSINPVHTAGDGDALFAVATGGSGKPGHLTVLGALAAEVTARAVLNAVRAAHSLAEPAVASVIWAWPDPSNDGDVTTPRPSAAHPGRAS
jgi:L-aminopeptidase/D-esterase-like protein